MSRIVNEIYDRMKELVCERGIQVYDDVIEEIIMKHDAQKLRGLLKEAITRITEDEMTAWKSGNLGYVSGDEVETDFDDNDRFLHGSEHGEAVDDEGYMAKSQLAGMKEMAYEVCELLDGDDQLPGWVQNHLAVAHENLRQVHGYLTGDAKMQAYEDSELPTPAPMPMPESKQRRLKALAEGHARITEEELNAWSKGDWGFVADVEPRPELSEAENKRKGPSKKTAQKILRGTKTFKDKVKKVEKWADDPEAAAAWMTHKATGKWPSEK